MWKRIFIIIVAIIIALEISSGLFLNIYTRLSKKIKTDSILAEYWQYDPYLLWIAKPGIKGFDMHGSFKMNNYAFRNDYDIAKEKTPGKLRIIVLGGSVAWGAGASSNQTVWTKVLEDLLKENNVSAEVLNAGCAGYISFQELIYLQFKLLDFSPDLVIVFDGYNDLFMSSLYSEKKYENNTTPYYEAEKSFYTQPLLVQIGGLVKERSNFFKLIKRTREKILYENGKPMYKISSLNKAGIANYFSNIKSVLDILKGRGIKGIFVLQPYIFESKKILSSTEKVILQKSRQEAPVIKEAMDVLRRDYRNFTVREGINFCDLNDVFDNIPVSQTVWFDHVHLNDQGNRIIAERLKDVIISILK